VSTAVFTSKTVGLKSPANYPELAIKAHASMLLMAFLAMETDKVQGKSQRQLWIAGACRALLCACSALWLTAIAVMR